MRLQEGEGEKDKERIQAFEGVVISKKGRASSATFTVRRRRLWHRCRARIFPLHSPTITSSIESDSARGHVRRARLYYLRELRRQGAARIKRAGKAREDVDAAVVAAGSGTSA